MNLSLQQYESLNPRCEVVHAGTVMTFVTPSVMTKGRVDTIYAKEPCTLEWIDSFGADDILVDVGANVGMYTIWAAATKKARVFAFEPEAQNYALLNRNIIANNLQGRTKAFCMGLSDRWGLTELNMIDMRVGGSNHAVGEALNFEMQPFKPTFQQGCIMARLDELVADGFVPVPNHIKIDVDGFEPKVIAGAGDILKNPGLRSLLIETNPNLPEHRAMVHVLTDLGFKYDPAQVHRAMRKDGPFKGVAEHVFRR
ncbi:MAG: FkbM family methyltransferase [Alphaproteobacteria bacterium]|nr:FkbM family methyltransferase [Alphaproteobacteria bacterium]